MQRSKPQATRAKPPKRPAFDGPRLPSPKQTGYALGAILGVSLLIGLVSNKPAVEAVPEENLSELRIQNLELSLDPNHTDPSIVETPEVSQAIEPLVVEVRNGDSMSLVFNRAGLGSSVVHKLAYESEHGDAFSRITPGNEFSFYFDADDNLEKVVYQVARLESYEAINTESGFDTRHVVLEPEVFTSFKSGTINNSFYLDGIEAGLNDNLIMELVNIFGWDIDFALEIRQGDRFSVVFEEKYLDGEFLGTGKILAAEFINRGKSIKAARYESSNGQVSYYTPEGLSMRKAFLRTPLDVFYISSHFNPNRRHPVLNTIRAHKGTDYAAPRGTPVKATGDGRVIFAGPNGSYGNLVKIQHGQNYETRYAHLDGFARGVRSGTWVQQGQIIGYVGNTGRVTGVHLHYEFHVNGVVRNPVTVQLPNGDPIDPSELERFKAATQPTLALLEVSRENYATNASSDNANDS